jgi:hypothetical protein
MDRHVPPRRKLLAAKDCAVPDDGFFDLPKAQRFGRFLQLTRSFDASKPPQWDFLR